jgi:hypothetical protein
MGGLVIFIGLAAPLVMGAVGLAILARVLVLLSGR